MSNNSIASKDDSVSSIITDQNIEELLELTNEQLKLLHKEGPLLKLESLKKEFIYAQRWPS